MRRQDLRSKAFGVQCYPFALAFVVPRVCFVSEQRNEGSVECFKRLFARTPIAPVCPNELLKDSLQEVDVSGSRRVLKDLVALALTCF